MLLTAQRAGQTFQRALRAPVDSAELLLFALGAQRAFYLLTGITTFEEAQQFRFAATVLPARVWGVLFAVPLVLAVVAMWTGHVTPRLLWCFLAMIDWFWLGVSLVLTRPTNALGVSFLLYAATALWMLWRISTDHARELRPVIGMDGAGDGRE